MKKNKEGYKIMVKTLAIVITLIYLIGFVIWQNFFLHPCPTRKRTKTF